MKYTVTAFKFHEEYTTENEARARFEEVKKNFHYCELKQVIENKEYYYSKSLKISCR